MSEQDGKCQAVWQRAGGSWGQAGAAEPTRRVAHMGPQRPLVELLVASGLDGPMAKQRGPEPNQSGRGVLGKAVPAPPGHVRGREMTPPPGAAVQRSHLHESVCGHSSKWCVQDSGPGCLGLSPGCMTLGKSLILSPSFRLFHCKMRTVLGSTLWVGIKHVDILEALRTMLCSY